MQKHEGRGRESEREERRQRKLTVRLLIGIAALAGAVVVLLAQQWL